MQSMSSQAPLSPPLRIAVIPATKGRPQAGDVVSGRGHPEKAAIP
jgi:hypothetical protein